MQARVQSGANFVLAAACDVLEEANTQGQQLRGERRHEGREGAVGAL